MKVSGISDAEFIEGAFIQEGVSPVAGIIIAACTLGDDRDNPKNRIGVRRQDVWLEFGLSAEAILSIDAATDGSAYILGENGSVVRFDWKSPTREELKASRKAYANPAVGNIGPLRRLRIIGGDVICAGSVGQVYRLLGDRFETLPKLSVGYQDATIEDIAGSSRSDVVAVTSEGYAAHFDGKNWTVLDLPTKAGLTSICRLDNGHYAIVGKNGTVLIGVADQWSIVQPIDTRRSYWGVATYDDEIYAAHLPGVDKVAGQTLIALDIEEADLQFTVLRSSAEGVLSFADRTIGLIRDDRWQTIMK
ncbi:hypothetical protein QSH18_19930 [Xanthomonas sp. NCPPB 2654]|uniref:hypothetical protein n=1 Tax=unclassified Xanthomonas TaxID=2643310 RepID=UPI0021E07308|nr:MULTISPECIES: hypothetical protein [unclassified Xanthomonas]MDL5367881.1 hypothetical protein [Xanthomonas sp. NCPPB 2654]UYC20280.1 hypothetical protein NUG20_19325 [Xanthomonas sp. CFBP 8443]